MFYYNIVYKLRILYDTAKELIQKMCLFTKK